MKKTTITFIFLMLSALGINAQKTKPTDYSQKIAEATPAALPQTPAVKRETTDAQDDGLKGKVKTITEKSEGFTGVSKGLGKTMSNYYEFDEKGNYLKVINYEYRGRPTGIYVYGYLDNKRVSRSGSVIFGDELRVIAVGATPKVESNAVPDTRYSLKYDYEYENGKLVKETLIRNNGERSMHYVYRYQNGQKEVLGYTEDGELNSKYVYLFDDKGNEIGYIDYDAFSPEVPEDERFKYLDLVYDKQGNWINRTVAKITVKNGKETYEKRYTEYRTITYHP